MLVFHASLATTVINIIISSSLIFAAVSVVKLQISSPKAVDDDFPTHEREKEKYVN
jgi:hypothetical protein